jgi:hypothetical protein
MLMVNTEGRPRHDMAIEDRGRLTRAGEKRAEALASADKWMLEIEEAAVQAYLHGSPIAQIAEYAQVTRNTIYKLLERRGVLSS